MRGGCHVSLPTSTKGSNRQLHDGKGMMGNEREK